MTRDVAREALAELVAAHDELIAYKTQFADPPTALRIRMVDAWNAARAALAEKLKQAPVEAPNPVPEARGGPLSQWVALRCKEPEFRRWYWMGYMPDQQTEEDTAEAIREQCGVSSRADLDHDERAAGILKRRVMEPWRSHNART